MTHASHMDTLRARAGADTAPLTILRSLLPEVARNVEPDQHVASEGGRRDTVIGVVSGLLRCFRVTPDGRRHVTRFVGPGGLIGLGAHSAYRNSTEAVAASRIVTFPVRALDSCAERHISVRNAIFRAMTMEMTARDRIQFRLGRLWADERVADFLLELSGETDDDGESRSISMSRADIADHLGITIETVSRALHRFQKAGLLRLDSARRFTILRVRDFQDFASGDSDDHTGPLRGVTAGERHRGTLCAA